MGCLFCSVWAQGCSDEDRDGKVWRYGRRGQKGSRDADARRPSLHSSAWQGSFALNWVIEEHAHTSNSKIKKKEKKKNMLSCNKLTRFCLYAHERVGDNCIDDVIQIKEYGVFGEDELGAHHACK